MSASRCTPVGRDAQLRPGQVVVMRVEVDDEGVGLDRHVSPGELPNDSGGFTVEQPGGDVSASSS